MNFELAKAIEILGSTPRVLSALLTGLSEEWVHANEGEGTWSPFDVVGHLIHGEKTDWIPRARIILGDGANKNFQPFDRFAQLEESRGKDMSQLLQEFEKIRNENLQTLQSFDLTEKDLGREGVHPVFGKVTLKELLATWVAHDLNHIAQICRAMAKQYKIHVGPWVEYLGILNK